MLYLLMHKNDKVMLVEFDNDSGCIKSFSKTRVDKLLPLQAQYVPENFMSGYMTGQYLIHDRV